VVSERCVRSGARASARVVRACPRVVPRVVGPAVAGLPGGPGASSMGASSGQSGAGVGRSTRCAVAPNVGVHGPPRHVGQLKHAVSLALPAFALGIEKGAIVPLAPVDFVGGRRWILVAV